MAFNSDATMIFLTDLEKIKEADPHWHLEWLRLFKNMENNGLLTDSIRLNMLPHINRSIYLDKTDLSNPRNS